ncbi:MAG: acylphosphatase [Pyrinomonadaceae bacterium]
MIARRYFVSGLVQGVGYRFFTQRAAARHQVKGLVKNLEDGRVLVEVEGREKSVQDFYLDLLGGPTYSRVEDIEEIVLEAPLGHKAFMIER